MRKTREHEWRCSATSCWAAQIRKWTLSSVSRHLEYVDTSTIRAIIEKRTCVHVDPAHREEDASTGKGISKDLRWTIAEVSWVFGSEVSKTAIRRHARHIIHFLYYWWHTSMIWKILSHFCFLHLCKFKKKAEIGQCTLYRPLEVWVKHKSHVLWFIIHTCNKFDDGNVLEILETDTPITS